MANFNPNAPGILGLEWRPVKIDSKHPTGRPIAQRIRSTAPETIAKLRWGATGAVTRNRHMMIVDIYQNGQEILTGTGGTVKQVEYSPSADTFNGGWFRRVDGLTTNLFQKIDENPVQYPPVRTDLGVYTQTGIPTEYRCRVASGAFSLTARVLRLEARLVIAAAGYEWRDTDFRLWWAGAGGPTIYNVPGSHVTTHYYGKLITHDFGEINPVTLAPWTPADVRAFSTASGWELRVEGVGNVISPVNLVALSLRVTYQDTENRKAAAIWRRPAVEFSSARAIESDRIVTLPGGTTNWSKANATDYTFVHRLAADPLVQYVSPRSNDILLEVVTDPSPRISPPNQSPWEYNYALSPVPGMAVAELSVDTWGRVVDFDGFSDTVNKMNRAAQLAMLLVNNSSVVSVDSQPYGHAGRIISLANRAYSGMSQYQEVTPGTTTSYIGVDFVVIPPDNTESTLTVQVTTTGGSPVGGSFTLTRAQAMLLPELWAPGFRRVKAWLSSGASLTAATTYRVTFSSNAPSEAEGWKIGTAGVPDVLYTGAGQPAAAGGLATFGGTTSRATYKGTIDPAVDLMVTLISQPTTPTVTAAVVTVTEDTPPHWCAIYCHPAAFEAPELTWTASAYSGFSHWEIEREEATLLGYWVPLVRITTEAQKTYRDYGARRNYAVRYRVRAVLNSGAFSDWHTSAQVLPRPKDSEVIFTSDADPSLTVVADREPSVVYQFQGTEEDTFVTTANQPYQTVYGSPVERGIRFELDVVVNMIEEPEAEAKGAGAFAALYQLAKSQDIPYVVVLDHEGQRFYAHIQVPEGVNEQPEHVYTTRVTITEVTDTPVVVIQP